TYVMQCLYGRTYIELQSATMLTDFPIAEGRKELRQSRCARVCASAQMASRCAEDVCMSSVHAYPSLSTYQSTGLWIFLSFPRGCHDRSFPTPLNLSKANR